MASDGLVRVTRSKFGKSREVPLHPSAAAALEEYARCRDELFPRPQSGAFLLGPAGSPLAYTTVLWAFGRLLDLAGVRAGPGQPRPGIHSLRHYADGWVMCPAVAFPLLGAAELVLQSA